jgi:branched-chain amino acid transport system permease protein
VVIGGLGSVRGSIIGAYLIGGLETLTATLVDPRLRGLGALVLLVLVLMLKPQGLFGHAEVEAE